MRWPKTGAAYTLYTVKGRGKKVGPRLKLKLHITKEVQFNDLIVGFSGALGSHKYWPIATTLKGNKSPERRDNFSKNLSLILNISSYND